MDGITAGVKVGISVGVSANVDVGRGVIVGILVTVAMGIGAVFAVRVQATRKIIKVVIGRNFVFISLPFEGESNRVAGFYL